MASSYEVIINQREEGRIITADSVKLALTANVNLHLRPWELELGPAYPGRGEVF